MRISNLAASLTLAAAALVASQGHASAAAITSLFSTGVNANGTVAANGATDLHYRLTSAPAGTTAVADHTSAQGYPFQAYVGDDSKSTWLTPVATSSYGPAGNYTYETTFSLTGFSVSSASISGQFAADNSVEIFLNGTDTGLSASSFTSWTQFSINTGFVSGNNVLDFVVNNSGTDASPTGLRTELTGTATASIADSVPVPEPASLALLGAGLVGVSLLRRKWTSAKA